MFSFHLPQGDLNPFRDKKQQPNGIHVGDAMIGQIWFDL